MHQCYYICQRVVNDGTGECRCDQPIKYGDFHAGVLAASAPDEVALHTSSFLVSMVGELHTQDTTNVEHLVREGRSGEAVNASQYKLLCLQVLLWYSLSDHGTCSASACTHRRCLPIPAKSTDASANRHGGMM